MCSIVRSPRRGDNREAVLFEFRSVARTHLELVGPLLRREHLPLGAIAIRWTAEIEER